MRDLPAGTVTFLATDIEGSTRLLERVGERYGGLLERHHELLRAAFGRAGGTEVDTQGDAFLASFRRATDAVAAAVDAQRAIGAEPWPDRVEVKVRMGIHTGQPAVASVGYVGLDLHRVARIAAAAHGGQVLLSQTARDLVAADMPADVTLHDVGEHRLKDLTQAQRLYQLCAAALESRFPPLRTLENRPTNLPVQPTPLIGREREVAAVSSLLMRDDVRLVSLTGAGGTGKTRLALQVAAELVDAFENGVFFVALEAVEDPSLLLATIAQTLGVSETGAEPLEETLKRFLADKRVLLVLDNFEQLLEAAPRLSELLAACPSSKLLVTSRAALRLSGEHEYHVPPLSLPEPRQLPAVDQLSRYEALALFVDRAQALRPEFAVTAENAPAIAEICIHLDGLPLAIELAAARSKLLTPQAMLARLGQRLALLTGGARDLPSRQQTLRGAIDWSYGLLRPDEQRLLARLAVFAGGCRLEAAEAVCEATLDDLEALVDNNLIRQEEQPDGEPRFFMLETIREYALERLVDLGEAEELGRRHARYVLAWAEARDAERRAGSLLGQWQREDEEHDNVRAALAWLRDAGEVEHELQLGAHMAIYWAARAHLTEGRAWLEDALSRGAGAPPLVQAAGMHAAAMLVWRQGDHERTRDLAERARSIFEASGDRRRVAECLTTLSVAAEWAGDLEREAELHDEAEAILRELRDERRLSVVLSNRGYHELVACDFERAERFLDESLAIARRLGRPADNQLLNLGLARLRLGRLRDAQTAFAEALRAGETGELQVILYAVEGLANVAAARGDGLAAARLWGASEAIRHSAGEALAPAERALHDEAVPAARASVDERAFDAAWAEGRALPLERAVELALGVSV